MNKFTVKVDLSTFFTDERKLVLILVDPTWENVECLQRRVETIFDVETVRFLTKDEECFIPPQEPIEVIKFIDTLKAFIPLKCLNKERKKAKRIRSTNDCDDAVSAHQSLPVENGNYESHKKRKYFTQTNSTPNDAKRSKSTADLLDEADEPRNIAIEIAAINEANCSGDYSVTNEYNAKERIKKKRKRLLNTTCHINLEDMECTTSLDKEAEPSSISKGMTVTNGTISTETHLNANGTKSNESKKLKRKSLLQNTSHINVEHVSTDQVENNADDQGEDDFAIRASNIPSSTIRNQSTRSTKSGKKETTLKTNTSRSSTIHQDKSHIFFNPSDEENESSVDEAAAENVVFRCSLSEINTTKPRIFRIRDTNSSIKILENVLIKPSELTAQTLDLTESNNTQQDDDSPTKEFEKEDLQQELPPDETSIVSVNNDEDVSVNKKDDETTEFEESDIIDLNESEDVNQLNVLTVAQLLPYAKELSHLPEVEDIVLFKILRLATDCTPTISNYIVGTCEYVNKRTKNVKLLVIDGKSEVEKLPSKFACNLDDSSKSDYINVKFTEMIEPKLCKIP